MTAKKWIFTGAALAAVGVLVWLTVARFSSEADGPGHETPGSGESTVAVVRVGRHDLGETLSISGAFKAFQDVDVHAKVAGYIKVIYVDVGDHVKQGQTLAILEVPELAAQLAGADASARRATEEIGRAQGDLDRAKSMHTAMHLGYTRLSDAAKTQEGLVALQDLDDAQAKDLETQAQVASAKSALSSAQQALEVAQANHRAVCRRHHQSLRGYRRARCGRHFQQHASHSGCAHRTDFGIAAGAPDSGVRRQPDSRG